MLVLVPTQIPCLCLLMVSMSFHVSHMHMPIHHSVCYRQIGWAYAWYQHHCCSQRYQSRHASYGETWWWCHRQYCIGSWFPCITVSTRVLCLMMQFDSLFIIPCRSVGIYAASKHGVVGWTRSCGIFKEVCNVRVNARKYFQVLGWSWSLTGFLLLPCYISLPLLGL